MSKSSAKKKIFYLTFSYYPSGVFKSQIFDTIKLLRTLRNDEVRLISFFSVRVFFKCRKWVKKDMPDAIVLPIIFGMKNWERHAQLLRWFVDKKDFIIGRNPMGAKIGLNYFDRVIYDGRSALKGEISEYDMALNSGLNQSFIQAEEYVVKNAAHRIAVSSELINFWKRDLNYTGKKHSIIPCSLAYSHEKELKERPTNKKIRLLFSGGGSPWQSQEEKYQWIKSVLDKNQETEFVFLSKTDEHLEALQADYPNRIIRKWLKPEEVFDELCLADYGILLREENLTNSVSAPVKFAEYLNAGLNVIISSCVKDYAHFVEEHHCGMVLKDLTESIELKTSTDSQRKKNNILAQKYFSKNSELIKEKYLNILANIDEH